MNAGMHRPRYAVGLDLGDGESTIAWADCGARGDDNRLYDRGGGEVSVVTAIARDAGGAHLFGDIALRGHETRHVMVNFKTRPRRSRLGIVKPLDAVEFANLFVSEFAERHPEVAADCVIYVGHPAGWTADAATGAEGEDSIAIYKEQLQAALGRLIVRMVAESQSAFLYVHDQSWVDATARPALVVDVGSSTIDFTLVAEGTPANLGFGDDLGCRHIDDEIRAAVLARLGDDQIREWLGRPTEASLLRWLSRRRKEAAFSGHPAEPPAAAEGSTLRGVLKTCWPALAELDVLNLVSRPGGWRDRFRAELARVRDHLGECRPVIVLTTGGGSRMPFIQELCGEVFPEAVVDPVAEPSLVVARGLASYGRWRMRVDAFRDGVRALADSQAIDDLMKEEATALAKRIYVAGQRNAEKVVIRPALAEIEAGADPRDALGDVEAQQRRLASWLATSDGQPVRDAILCPLEQRVDRALQPHAAKLCTDLTLDAHALSTRITLPPDVFVRPRGALFTAWFHAANKGLTPMLRAMARSRTGRAYIRASLRAWQPATGLAGAAYAPAFRLGAADVAELTEAVRDEVRKQLLRNAQPIEQLLAQ